MIKNILILIAITILFSCKKENKRQKKQKNYVVFSGKITNKNSDSIIIKNERIKFKKVIKVSKNGVFKDSFNLKKPNFLTFSDGIEEGRLYLKNGDNISVKVNTKDFDNTLSFLGQGCLESDFLNKKFLLREDFLKHDAIYHLSKENFDACIKDFENSFLKKLQKIKKQDNKFVLIQKKELKIFKRTIEKSFNKKSKIRSKLKTGMPSPEFSKPCKSKTEKKYSLKDFRGKYVYIEFWATWCDDCKNNHQYYKELSEKLKDKNIQFIGVSIDSESEYSTWLETCNSYDLPGIQLFCSDDSTFTKAYLLGEIPRFVILDPEGKIINAFAPRASDPNIIKILNELEI